MNDEEIMRLSADPDNDIYDVTDAGVLSRARETDDGAVSDISHEELVGRLKYVKAE